MIWTLYVGYDEIEFTRAGSNLFEPLDAILAEALDLFIKELDHVR